MSKSKQKGQKAKINLPPITFLRIRLDDWLAQPQLEEQDEITLKTGLANIVSPFKAAQYLPILLKAYQAAPPEIQQQLQNLLPAWLTEWDSITILLEWVEQGKVEGADRQVAMQWLAAEGLKVNALQVISPFSFADAYFHENGSQGILIIACYDSPKKQKIYFMQFLIDYNPPWEGGIKDAFSRHGSMDKFNQKWVREVNSVMPLTQITAEGAAKILMECLESNREENIRLPRDFIAMRDLFWQCFPTLPQIAQFTPADFDDLCHLKQIPEQLRQFEQHVGAWTRMPDGEKVFLAGGKNVWDDDF